MLPMMFPRPKLPNTVQLSDILLLSTRSTCSRKCSRVMTPLIVSIVVETNFLSLPPLTTKKWIQMLKLEPKHLGTRLSLNLTLRLKLVPRSPLTNLPFSKPKSTTKAVLVWATLMSWGLASNLLSVVCLTLLDFPLMFTRYSFLIYPHVPLRIN